MFRSSTLIILSVCLFLAQIVGWRLWRRRFANPLYQKLITVVFVVFNLGWLASLYQWRVAGNELSGSFLAWVARPSISWQALHIFIILPAFALVSSLTWLGRRVNNKISVPKKSPLESPANSPANPPIADSQTHALATDPARNDPLISAPLISMDRRQFLKTAANVGFFGLVGFCSYGVYRQYRFPDVIRLTISVPNLPAALAGFTVAQLSDTHIGLWSTERELDAAMFTAKAEKPDLVVLTGDLVDRDPNMAALYGPPLNRHLKDIPYGVFGILGNHDHFTDPVRIARILREVGVNTLVDLRHNFPGLPLSMVGLDDRRGRIINTKRNFKSDPDLLDFSLVQGPAPRAGDFQILLNHRPEGVSQAVRAGYQLYLAGHTHGGQYAWPGSNHRANLASLFYKYTAGLYPVDSGWINVSCGLAAVGVPFRLVTWPEISVITLEKA